MPSERWQKIRALFDAASEIKPNERERFLEDACGKDVELREEVGKLLDSFDNAEGFMNSPAVGEVADLIVEKQKKLDTGQQIDSYEIISQIGEGGMGEVYLAKDTRLKRNVALKLLAAHITEDKDRVSRFRQEAFATSALNHPNIITIYEIGEWNGRDFIVTEFVEGTTLRSLLHNKKLSIGETLDITLQITNGLTAAHDAEIVHRDIKPENIMIRTDGLVKILDFGIAKYSPTEDGQKALVETAIGEVIGTTAYMSPEQARGLEIDVRTDIWSLGVILYEMIARKLPFPGETKSDRIVSILEHKQESLAKTRRKVPNELQEITDKALTKDKENRYQHMAEMAKDLHKLCEQTGIKRRSILTVSTNHKRQSFKWIYAVSALIILLLVSGGVWFYLNGGNFFANKSALSLESMQIERLSDTSQAVYVAISPDGEFVAFVKEEKGEQSLWLKQISAPSSVEIVSPSENMRFGSPIFSADGSYVYYLKTKSEDVRATLFQIPKLGGEEKKLIEDISLQDSGSNFSLSPDGKQVAFIRLDEQFNRSLVITNLDGKGKKTLATQKIPNYLTGAAFSPNGKMIATITGRFGGKQKLILVDVAEAKENPLGKNEWAGVQGLRWFDNYGLIISAAEKEGLVQLWHISNPDSKVTRITKDLSDYGTPSLTENSSTVAAVQTIQNTHIWTNNLSTEKQLTFGNGGKDGSFGMALTPDGGVVYTSQVSGNSEIWSVNADGSSNKQLTNDLGVSRFPDVSPDGKYIVFNVSTDKIGEVWRMDIDGKNPIKLTDGSIPSFSSDSKWIYFYHFRDLFRIPIEGGEATQIQKRERDTLTAPIVSPNNKMIAGNYLVGEPNAQFRIGIVPIEGGNPVRVFDTFSYAIKPLRWLPDNKSVTFIDTREGISNIFKHSLEGTEAKQVTNFKSDIIWNFDWSKDGKKLALSRGNITRDVVLISDFK